MGAVDRGIRASRSEFSAAGIVIGLNWWPCQTAATAAAAAASVAKPVSVAQWRQRHDHEGVPGLDRRGEVRGWQRHTCFQNPGLFFLPGRTTTRTPQGKSPTSWKCLIATESTRCGLVDVPLSSKSTFQQLWTSKHQELRCRHPQEFVHQGRVERQRRHVPREW